MSLFFRKRKETLVTKQEEKQEEKQEKQKQIEEDKPLLLEKKKVNLENQAECYDYVSEQCEQIAIAKRQLEETKIEYAAVTEYLTDIQKIERIPEEEKDRFLDAARKMIALTNERNRFQNREVKITDHLYKHMEKYEDSIPKEIETLKQNEAYQAVINEDMRQLEGEKGALYYQMDEIISKQKYLKVISIITCILVAVLFAVFYLFYMLYEANVETPLLMTIAMAGVGVFLIFLEATRNRKEMYLAQRKLNRAIGLLNKVKIKYINNRNNIDYAYQKYCVNAAKELEFLWRQYVIAKDEAKRYQQNTELIEYYSNVLIDELDRYDLKDSEVWIYQPHALVTQKEMVEVRHRLNQRRQKLREQVDYNNTIIETSTNEITKIYEKHEVLREQIEQLCSKIKGQD